MKKEVVKETRRMGVRGRMGEKWKEFKGERYHTPPPFCFQP
jgi:hypothetical protein